MLWVRIFLHQTDLRKAALVLPGERKKSFDFLFGFLMVDFVLVCMRLPRGRKSFVLKFDCEIPTGFGEIKVYTFGIGFQWARLRISKWNRKCGALRFGIIL